MNFWDIIRIFLEQGYTNDDMVEYQFEGLDDLKCVITIYSEGDSILVINLIEKDQWDLIVDFAEFTNTEIPDVVKNLTEDEVKQVRLDLSKFDLE